MIVLFSPYVLWGVFINVLNIPLGIGLTHAYRALVQWQDWTELSLRRLVSRVVAATLVLSILYVAGSTLIALATNPWSPFGGITVRASRFIELSLRMSPVLLLWSVIYFGIHYFWNYRSAEIDRLEMEVQSRGAKLNALKLQLNPHFLFNSLNSVRALVTEDPRQAQTMITRLARLLRTTLKSSKTVTVPLRKELALVRTYLELEAVRLEERLAYQIDVPPEVRTQPVPPMLVQTLVENAIKHGIATRPEGGTVRVSAHSTADALHLRVANTGRLGEADRSGGIGLQNVRERLQLLFGDDAALTLQMDGPDTVVATARLPRTLTAAAQAPPKRTAFVPEPA